MSAFTRRHPKSERRLSLGVAHREFCYICSAVNVRKTLLRNFQEYSLGVKKGAMTNHILDSSMCYSRSKCQSLPWARVSQGSLARIPWVSHPRHAHPWQPSGGLPDLRARLMPTQSRPQWAPSYRSPLLHPKMQQAPASALKLLWPPGKACSI